MPTDRLARLPATTVLGAPARRADSPRARLLGLALLDTIPERSVLLIPRCGSVHTFGMRFAIDVVFLNRLGVPLRVVESLPPRRAAGCRGARSVIETRAGEARRVLDLAGE
ncbi:MAG: DUF192 domain-containing protein [Thermoleophilaceae bacterium]|nr:DUF192 domain-containing protein [Thermoleophilaceae bacterium]